MKQLDLLLINPGNRTQNYQWLASSISAIENPIWPGLLATFVRNQGHSVAILDANALALTPQQIADSVAAVNPRLVALVVYGQNPSASTQLMPAVSDICSALKQRTPKQPILLLGGHVAAVPDRTLAEECADFTCDGEGAYTLVELIRALQTHAKPDLGQVRGLRYRHGDRIVSTPPAPLVKDLDTLMPGIAWDLLPMDRYRAHNWHCFDRLSDRSPYAALYTTLGCPFHCAFCCIQAPFRTGERALGYNPGTNSYRRFLPDTIIREIDLLVQRYGVSNIKLADELFVLNREHVLGICNHIIARGYHLNIWAYARVDSIQPDILPTLKRAGINWLAFGIESASERVRQDVHKGFAPEKVQRTINAVHENGIHVIGNFIFGLPEDDRTSMQATLDLARSLECDFVNFSCAMAYPGSQLYEQALASGAALPKHWGGYSQYAVDSLPLPTRHLSGAEVLEFRDRAFVSFFTDPTYLARIGRLFGDNAVEHIRNVCAHRLERSQLNSVPTKQELLGAYSGHSMLSGLEARYQI
jgi:anaerobic magnesium-protoporphyrin IX monomethyl ester cyclase